MEEFSIEQLSYCIVMVFGAIGGLFHIVQRSRCTKINVCGMKCDREPAKDEEMGGIALQPSNNMSS